MINAPAKRWKLAVATGVPFGLWMGVYYFLQGGRSLVTGGVMVVLAGVIFGFLMAKIVPRLISRMWATVPEADSLTREERKLVHVASNKGPVPADPRLRRAAVALLEYQLGQGKRIGRWTIALMAVMAVVFAVLGFTESPWYWIGTVVWGGIVLSYPSQNRRLRERLPLLEADIPA